MLGIILTLVAVLIALSFAFYSDYSAEENARKRSGDSLLLRRSQPAVRRRG